MPVVPALGRLRPEHSEFEGSLGYIDKLCLHKNKLVSVLLVVRKGVLPFSSQWLLPLLCLLDVESCSLPGVTLGSLSDAVTLGFLGAWLPHPQGIQVSCEVVSWLR
jgi:hypothetical protein